MRYKVSIFPDKEKGKEDARLRCRVYWQGKTAQFLVGYRINPDRWSYEAQRCMRNSIHNGITAQRINHEIEAIIKAVDDVLRDDLTKAEFTEAMNEKRGKNKKAEAEPITFKECWEHFCNLRQMANLWTDKERGRYDCLLGHIIEYDENVTMNKLSERWLQGLTAFFVGKGFHNSTTAKNMKRLKGFLTWAEGRGYCHDVSDYKPRLKDAQNIVVFLDWDELMAVYGADLKQMYKKRVRDLWCFQAFTGLRYSDALNLTKANIVDGSIDLISIKDHEHLNIHLNKFALAIIDKYADEDTEHLFPRISNQRYNEYIKLVMKDAGIDRPITLTHYVGNERHEETKPKYELIATHSARRTFICNALALGIPVTTVMKWTGHSDYKAMQPYIDVSDAMRKSEMEKFNTVPSRPDAGQNDGV